MEEFCINGTNPSRAYKSAFIPTALSHWGLAKKAKPVKAGSQIFILNYQSMQKNPDFPVLASGCTTVSHLNTYS